MDVDRGFTKALVWGFAYAVAEIAAIVLDARIGTYDYKIFQIAARIIFIAVLLIATGERGLPLKIQKDCGPWILLSLIPVALMDSVRIFAPTAPLGTTKNLMLILSVISSVAAEEILFRFFADRALSAYCSGSKRIFFAAAVYALACGMKGLSNAVTLIAAIIVAFCLGLMLQAVYAASGSILVSFLIHFAVKGVTVLADNAGKSGMLNFGTTGYIIYYFGIALCLGTGMLIIIKSKHIND